MLPKIKQRKEITEVPRLEWDFSYFKKDKKDKKSELRDCYFYEFSREDQAVRKWVNNWREKTSGIKFDDWKPFFNRLSKVKRHPFLFEVFTFSPEWPVSPYLSIPAKERARRINLILRPPPNADTSRALNPINISMFVWERLQNKVEPTQDEMERGIFKMRDHFHELAAFQIDWRHTDGTLTNSFAEWLKMFRPKEIEQWKIKGKGMSSVQMMKELKALGAWRLIRKFGMKWDEAENLTSQGNAGEEIAPLCEGQSNWSRACRLVETRNNQFISSRFY
jgi:hypothetical protein